MPEETKIASKFETKLGAFRSLRDTAINLSASGQHVRGREQSVGPARDAFREARDALKGLLDKQGEVSAAEYAKGQAVYASSRRLTLGMSIAFVLIGAALAWWIIKSITGPLADVQQVLTLVSEKGDLSGRVPVRRNDELGKTAEALNTVLAELDDIVSDVSGVMTNAADGQLSKRVTAKTTGQFSVIKTSINGALGSLEAVLADIDQVMRSLAAGDMTARVKVPAKGQLADIKNNMNRSLGELSQALARIAHTIRRVAAATNEASSAVGQVSDGAQHQLSALKQVAAGMTQTSQAIVHVSSSARESSLRAREAAQLVSGGTASVDAMVNVVRTIREHSEQVGRITEVLSQLASQTNMLSLNAAIEAARAGEHGKGFAVVAEQVGRLAESSAKSSKDIVDLVGRAAKETHRGVEVAGSVRGSFDAIAMRVVDTDKMVESIATAMEEQQAAVTQINASVSDLSRIGQTNAAAAEEITATMIEVAQLSKQTRDDVDRFKVS